MQELRYRRPTRQEIEATLNDTGIATDPQAKEAAIEYVMHWLANFDPEEELVYTVPELAERAAAFYQGYVAGARSR